MDDYGKLNTASLGTEYLVTNATTHSFIFGAMAELVDNARDAGSEQLSIYKDKTADGSTMVSFLDDGCGMSKEEAENVIVFGSSRKTDQEEPIGMYGNGLKSGSMRLGKDMILFTKKDGTITLLMISRTFFEAENVTQIKVPVPYFDANTRRQLGSDKKKNAVELELILKYSPFKTMAALQKQFDLLSGPSGTLIIVYNLSTTPNGNLELDFESDDKDIRTAAPTSVDLEPGEEWGDVEERRSFRAYASILYKSPRMKIILRGKRVRTRHLAYSLYMPKRITVIYKNFKNQAEKQIHDIKRQVETQTLSLSQLQGEISNLTKNAAITNKTQMSNVRKLQTREAELKSQLDVKKKIMELRKKQSKKSENLEFYFGINLNERYHDGMFFYNADRLIKMYVKEGTLQAKEEITYRGIIAVISVPKSALLPTHNKQDFNDLAEYKKLRKCVDQAMQQYWEEVVLGDLQKKKKTATKMWEDFGYSSVWRKPPSEDKEYKMRRARQKKHLQQCDKCLKWRVIPYHSNFLYEDFPDSWVCADSMDPSCNKCNKAEALPKIDSQPLNKARLTGSGTSVSKPAPAPPKTIPTMREVVRREEKEREERLNRKKQLEAYRASERSQREPSPTPAKRRATSSVTPSPATRKVKPSPGTASKHTPAKNSPSPRISKPTPASRKAQRQTSRDSSSPEPSPPPLRVMRRSSPSRSVKKQEPVTPLPPAKARPSARSTAVKETRESSDEEEEQSNINGGLSDSANMSEVKVEKTPSVSMRSAQSAGSQGKENQGSSPSPANDEKQILYRFVRDDDLNDQMMGEVVQGRFQNKWQDATVMAVRNGSVLLRFKNKTSLSMKVNYGERVGEVRMEVSDEKEAENTDVVDSSPPSASNTTNHVTAPDTAVPDVQNVVAQATAEHIAKNTALIKTLREIVSEIDVSGDMSSTHVSKLTSTELKSALKKYSGNVKKETEEALAKQHKAELSKARSDTNKMKAELLRVKDEFKKLENTDEIERKHKQEIGKLKGENLKIRSELARVKEDSKRQVQDVTAAAKKEEDRKFQELKGLFKNVLDLCIGQGPESNFNTHEELVALLQTISSSLSAT